MNARHVAERGAPITQEPIGRPDESAVGVAGPLIISHRANMKVAPENTIAAIQSALDVCVDGIEVDVQVTSDGLAVLMHDCTMHRAIGDPRTLGDVSSDIMRKLRVIPPRKDVPAEPIATLADALEVARDRAILVLDVKMEQIAPVVAKVIRDACAERGVHVQCDLDEAGQYRELLPEVPITVGLRAGAIKRHGLIALLDRCVELGIAGVSIRNRILDACAVREAHARGLTVKTWTGNRTSSASWRPAWTPSVATTRSACATYARRPPADLSPLSALHGARRASRATLGREPHEHLAGLAPSKR